MQSLNYFTRTKQYSSPQKCFTFSVAYVGLSLKNKSWWHQNTPYCHSLNMYQATRVSKDCFHGVLTWVALCRAAFPAGGRSLESRQRQSSIFGVTSALFCSHTLNFFIARNSSALWWRWIFKRNYWHSLRIESGVLDSCQLSKADTFVLKIRGNFNNKFS